MWSACKKCGRLTTSLVLMSDDTWKFSLGKFLEVRRRANRRVPRPPPPPLPFIFQTPPSALHRAHTYRHHDLPRPRPLPFLTLDCSFAFDPFANHRHHPRPFLLSFSCFRLPPCVSSRAHTATTTTHSPPPSAPPLLFSTGPLRSIACVQLPIRPLPLLPPPAHLRRERAA